MASYMDYILVKHAEAVGRVRSRIRSFTSNSRSNEKRREGHCQVFSKNYQFTVVEPKNIIVAIPNITSTMRSFFNWISEHIVEQLRLICAGAFSWLQDKIRSSGHYWCDRAFCARTLGYSNWNVSGKSMMFRLDELVSMIGRVMMIVRSMKSMLLRFRKLSNVSVIIQRIDGALFYGGFVLCILGLIQDLILFVLDVQPNKSALCY